jgi:hypothetical protein
VIITSTPGARRRSRGVERFYAVAAVVVGVVVDRGQAGQGDGGGQTCRVSGALPVGSTGFQDEAVLPGLRWASRNLGKAVVAQGKSDKKIDKNKGPRVALQPGESFHLIYYDIKTALGPTLTLAIFGATLAPGVNHLSIRTGISCGIRRI